MTHTASRSLFERALCRGRALAVVLLALATLAGSLACGSKPVNNAPVVEPEPQRSRLLLSIAVDRYRDDAGPAAGAEADADALRQALVADARNDNVTVNEVTLRGPNATRQRIRDQIDTLARNASDTDTIIIAFHGLGAALRLRGSFAMPEGPTRLFIAPFDVDPSTPERTRDSCVLLDDFAPVLKSRAEAVVIVLDCGFGAKGRALTTETIEPAQLDQLERHLNNLFATRGGRSLVLAGNPNDPRHDAPSDPDNPDAQGSLFTHEAVVALTGGADADRDGRITLGEFMIATRATVPAKSNREQKPMTFGAAETSLFLCYCRAIDRPGPAANGGAGTNADANGNTASASNNTSAASNTPNGTGVARGFESVSSKNWALPHFFSLDFAGRDVATKIGLDGSSGMTIEGGNLSLAPGREFMIPLSYGDAVLSIEFTITPTEYTQDELNAFGEAGPPVAFCWLTACAGDGVDDARYVWRLESHGHAVLLHVDGSKISYPKGSRAEANTRRSQSAWSRLPDGSRPMAGERSSAAVRILGDTMTLVAGSTVIERIALRPQPFGQPRGRFAIGVSDGAALLVHALSISR